MVQRDELCPIVRYRARTPRSRPRILYLAKPRPCTQGPAAQGLSPVLAVCALAVCAVGTTVLAMPVIARCALAVCVLAVCPLGLSVLVLRVRFGRTVALASGSRLNVKLSQGRDLRGRPSRGWLVPWCWSDLQRTGVRRLCRRWSGLTGRRGWGSCFGRRSG